MCERAGKKNGNNNGWQFWQQHNQPLEIKDQEMFDKTLEYIHLNPVVAALLINLKIGNRAPQGIFVSQVSIRKTSLN